MRYVSNLIAPFQSEHLLSFVTAHMVDNVEELLGSDFLTEKPCQTRYQYIWTA